MKLAKAKNMNTMKCGQDQEMRRSSGKTWRGLEASTGTAAACAMGSPGSSGEGESAGGGSAREGKEGSCSGGSDRLSSNSVIVFFPASFWTNPHERSFWASQKPTQRRPAAEAVRGGR